MDDITLVVRACSHLEQVLEERLGAQGRGLHEKITSVSGHLPTALVKHLRWLATLRNKVVHEGYVLPDRKSYIMGYNTAVAELERMRCGNYGVAVDSSHRTSPDMFAFGAILVGVFLLGVMVGAVF